MTRNQAYHDWVAKHIPDVDTYNENICISGIEGLKSALKDTEGWQKRGITKIVSVVSTETIKEELGFLKDCGTPWVPIELDDVDDDPRLIPAGYQCSAILEEKGRVFLHCSAGISRSPAMIMFYEKLKNPGRSLDDILQEIQKKRRIADPSEGFKKQMRREFA